MSRISFTAWPRWILTPNPKNDQWPLLAISPRGRGSIDNSKIKNGLAAAQQEAQATEAKSWTTTITQNCPGGLFYYFCTYSSTLYTIQTRLCSCNAVRTREIKWSVKRITTSSYSQSLLRWYYFLAHTGLLIEPSIIPQAWITMGTIETSVLPLSMSSFPSKLKMHYIIRWCMRKNNEQTTRWYDHTCLRMPGLNIGWARYYDTLGYGDIIAIGNWEQRLHDNHFWIKTTSQFSTYWYNMENYSLWLLSLLDLAAI